MCMSVIRQMILSSYWLCINGTGGAFGHGCLDQTEWRLIDHLVVWLYSETKISLFTSQSEV